MPEPRKSKLSQILKEHPDERPRIARAVASLVGIGLVSLTTLGLLVIWHVHRRARLIRERLNPPRIVRLPDLGPEPDSGTDSTEFVSRGPESS
ncbi:hypothetical protein ACYOEI_34275 [Singulisphaera rosea]